MTDDSQKEKQRQERIVKVHEEACRAGSDFYFDPETRLCVFTEIFLKNRGYCCQSSCRHCPYGFKK